MAFWLVLSIICFKPLLVDLLQVHGQSIYLYPSVSPPLLPTILNRLTCKLRYPIFGQQPGERYPIILLRSDVPFVNKT